MEFDTLSLNNAALAPVSIVVEPSQAGQRIDKFLSLVLSSYSRNFFQNIIDGGGVTINNHPAKSSYSVKAGDCILITLPEEQKRPLYTQVTSDLGIQIVATHEHFFIINKPAGLLVHQTEAHTSEPTVVDWLLSNHYDLHDVGSPERPGIVHRLDKETSGLLIIPRTNFAHMTFGNMFKNRTMSKTYWAIVEGHPEAQGSIELSIGRHPTLRKKMMTHLPAQYMLTCTKTHKIPREDAGIRNALTHYKVLEYYENHSLVELKPVTGRTHQIRVHMAAIGHPLVGDYLYGSASKLIERHALHAQSISFTLQEKPFHFTQEVPADFNLLISTFKNS